jgi:hypothetical protein
VVREGLRLKVLPKKQLERKLHDAVRLARARLENRQEAP